MYVLIVVGAAVLILTFFLLKLRRRGHKCHYWQEGASPSVADLIAKCRELGHEEFATALEADLRPCIRVRHAVAGAPVRSKLGGLPALAGGVSWPRYKGKSLSFVAQFDLAEMPVTELRDLLPRNGTLYFFFDQDQEAWGFDPKHKEGWAVIYTESTPDPALAASAPDDLTLRFTEIPVELVPEPSLPDFVGYAPLKALEDQPRKQVDNVCDEYDRLTESEEHHFFGYAGPVQGADMDLECQLASNGVYVGDADGYKTPRARELAPGASKWRLLFQADTDHKADMMWGDCGRLYFWITDDDLRHRRFQNVWTILQCT